MYLKPSAVRKRPRCLKYFNLDTGAMMKNKTSMTTEELGDWVISQIEEMAKEEQLAARIALIKEFSPERIGAESKLVM
jgi:hypothetical protein